MADEIHVNDIGTRFLITVKDDGSAVDISSASALQINFRKPSDEIINNLLRLGESIGDVMEETRKALDDDKVDEDEKEQISIEVIELEKKIAELKLKLNLGEKTNYKIQNKREP